MPGAATRTSRPTLRDVAHAASVSAGTVSAVLNHREDARIGQVTRQRVWAAINELGYRPNLMARQLRTQQTHTIGLVTDYIASTPFAGQIVLAAHNFAWQADHLLFLVNTDGDAEVEQTAVRLLVDRGVDGFIYAAQSTRKIVVPAEMLHVPAVLVNAFTADKTSTIPSVLPEEAYGGALAAQHLIEAGHRKIVYLAGDQRWATRERVLGVRNCLEAAGLPTGRSAITYGKYDTDSGYDRAIKILRRADRPTALLCGNDRIALGALLAAQALGLTVPDDLSLVGYDDQEDLADRLRPTLTTVTLPHYEMGNTGARSLLELIGGARVDPCQMIRGQLIERGSVKPPPPGL